MNEELLQKVKQVLPGVDAAVDMFDLRLIWASPKLLKMSEYSEEEFLKLRIIDILNKNKMNEEEFRKIISERIGLGSGTSSFQLLTKFGKEIELEVKYEIITFLDGWFMASEVISYK